jgi:hypothetical protein
MLARCGLQREGIIGTREAARAVLTSRWIAQLVLAAEGVDGKGTQEMNILLIYRQQTFT